MNCWYNNSQHVLLTTLHMCMLHKLHYSAPPREARQLLPMVQLSRRYATASTQICPSLPKYSILRAACNRNKRKFL